MEHPTIRDSGGVMVFSTPHAELQEVVAVAMLHGSPVDLTQVRAWASLRLGASQLPQLLVLVPEFPRTLTLKLKRLGFAETLGLKDIRGGQLQTLSFSPDNPGGLPRLKQLPTQPQPQEVPSHPHAPSKLQPSGELFAEQPLPVQAQQKLSPLRLMDAGEVERMVIDAVRSMRTTTGTVDSDVPLTDIGIDSMSGVELALILRSLTGVNVPVTIAYESVTVRDIARVVVETKAGSTLNLEAQPLPQPHAPSKLQPSGELFLEQPLPVQAQQKLSPLRLIDAGEAERMVIDAVRSMRTTTGTVDSDVPLTDIGIDSMSGVELALILRSLTGVNVPVTIAYESVTVRDIARVVVETKAGSTLNLEAQPLPLPRSHSLQPTFQLPLLLPPPMQMCRCLMLHGHAANSQLMESMLRQTGWLDQLATKVEFVFIDALHEHAALPEFYPGLTEASLYGDELGQTYYHYG